MSIPSSESKCRNVDLYFDYVSPFAYLLNEQLHRLPNNVRINHIPVLFAGLLKHWGQLGPVEVEGKRQFTYRHTTWLAEKLDVTFKIPSPHPFNPLPYLRLSIALGNSQDIVSKIYEVLWTRDLDPTSQECWNAVCEVLSITNSIEQISAPEVKMALRTNTESAIELGVFGVPTFVIDGEIFWGLDSIEFLFDYLADNGLFRNPAMDRLSRI